MSVDESDDLVGSPPRVRSRQRFGQVEDTSHGITSACAEQTTGIRLMSISIGDHLRVCGADISMDLVYALVMGSPPRVRSRPVRRGRMGRPLGITSACAEQTAGRRRSGQPARDHLRVCGADIAALSPAEPQLGSPPRVRSRPDHASGHDDGRGITSACAEQTNHPAPSRSPSGDHLRVCGADMDDSVEVWALLGSPPRVRSRHHRVPKAPEGLGITSACAEQTNGIRRAGGARWDHLRVCGADASSKTELRLGAGSPPRVRSRPQEPRPRRLN